MELNHWFVHNNELSISLMRFYVSITLKRENDNNYFELEVNNSDMKKNSFKFNSLEDAVNFTEIVINKSWTIDEVVNGYSEYLELERTKVLKKAYC